MYGKSSANVVGKNKKVKLRMPRPKYSKEEYTEGYWANEGEASGILPICKQTGRIGLGWRSSDVHKGDCWGTFGGALKQGLDAAESAKEELKEETGYHGPIELELSYKFIDGNFSYQNYLGWVAEEFQLNPNPDHKWETSLIEWFSQDELLKELNSSPNDFHPGLRALITHERDRFLKTASEANPELETFMRDFWGNTYGNPFDPRERVWKNIAAVECFVFNNAIHISSIRSFERAKGFGSAALKWICELADAHQVTLELSPEPYGDKPLSAAQLKSWYKRNGFVYSRGGMVRKPKNLKVAAPRSIWYHGSSIKNLRSILAQGLILNPKTKNWGKDPDAHSGKPSRESYGGIYVTQNLLTAKGSPRDWWQEGRGLVIVCELQPNTLLADEDNFQYYIDSSVLSNGLTNYYNVGLFYFAATLPKVDSEWGLKVEYQVEHYQQTLEDAFSRVLRRSDREMHPELRARLRPLLKDLWLVAIQRKAAHLLNEGNYKRVYTTLFGEDSYASIPPLTELVPSVPEAEREYRAQVEQLTRTLKQSAVPKEEPPEKFQNNTARVETPIGYSGSNRILAVVEIQDGTEYRKQTWHDKREDFGAAKIISHYGTIPEDFFRQYKKHIGDNFVVEEKKKTASDYLQIFYNAAKLAREEVNCNEGQGKCQEVSEALETQLIQQGYDAWSVFGWFDKHPHVFVRVGEYYIDPTYDQFNENEDIKVGNVSDQYFKKHYGYGFGGGEKPIVGKVSSEWVWPQAKRCTQATLEALGVRGKVPTNDIGVEQALMKAGKTIELIDDAANQTVKVFVTAHPTGSYYIVTLYHAMALVNGVLTDTEGRGIDERKIIEAFAVK
jgi:8-oxo-dGTP pyrophosphatase MutT (NUDIX family)